MDDETVSAESAGEVHYYDQVEAAIRDTYSAAQVVAAYYTALREGNVPAKLAGELTQTWQRHTMGCCCDEEWEIEP